MTYFKPDTPCPEQSATTKIIRNEDYVQMNKEDSSLEWESVEKAIDFFEKPIAIYTNHLSCAINNSHYDRP